MNSKILVIDDDPDLRGLLYRFLSRKGFEVYAAGDGKEALQLIREHKVSIALCDFQLPDLTGAELIKKMKILEPALKAIVITAYSDVDTAVESMKAGAFDYVNKPLNHEEILQTINSALKSKDKPKPQKGDSVSDSNKSDYRFVEGVSHNAKVISKHIKLVAPTDMSVLVLGETGTGKEAVARQVHGNSNRKEYPFVAVDCGALPRDIAGSELFGHVKGAFTGALKDKMGLFEQANKGTLFLDEIGNLSYEVQVQLLRALQENKIRRIGDSRDRSVDVRIIAATNEDLASEVEDGIFREDLYHRINEFKLKIEPLRNRVDDIDLFADHFLRLSNDELGKSIDRFSSEVLDLFHNYSWRGNLRELKNVIKRAVLLCEDDQIEVEHLPDDITYHKEVRGNRHTDNGNLKAAALQAEAKVIIEAINNAGGNKSEAARTLNIDRKTLYNKLNQLNIDI